MQTIDQYIALHSSQPSDLLDDLERETYLKKLYPQMISGKLQGKFLKFISMMIKPKNILELGTFTGYSALCLAEGLTPNGTLHTVEFNDEHQPIIKKYFEKSPKRHQLKLHIGKAEDIIPTLDEKFDLVFIDADKKNYIKYYELVLPRLNPGGFILADNVLWYEKVLLPENQTDEVTNAIKKFNKHVQEDNRTENIILPLRDGLSLIYKK